MILTAESLAEMIKASRETQGITTDETTGSTTIQGPEGMSLARLITLKSGLRLESRVPGMKLTRGVSCLAIARRDYGIKARTAADAYAKLCAMFDSAEGKETKQQATTS